MICTRCSKEIVSQVKNGSGAPGYAIGKDGNKVCYACCAELDWQAMDTSGKYTLYLTKDADGWKITNWPGSLEFHASVTVHKHGHYSPFAGYMERRDAWFRDHAGHLWHARSVGDWTDIAHCKRLKDTPENLACALRIGSGLR